MKLPARFENLLKQDNALNALTLRAITVIEPWARDNKTVFFPEYTDHSLVHLAEVLATADSLISDNSWAHLTSEDAAVIVIAVLLHDSALHLTEEGFFTLINGRYLATNSRYIVGEPSWPDLWNQFLGKARRFDQRKLHSLFGDTEPVRDIPTKKLELTLKHRLLIGEFLRLHHARLAHEIALNGIPGVGESLRITDDTNPEIMDLAGFVARSHNLSIRAAIDVLENSKRRVHLNCRVPFAMVVLRIADYLQIHSARAPGQLLRLKDLSSPVSRGEWRKHNYVKEINQAHEDPEALFVDCEPDSASGFLAVRNLLRDIQAELDQCWAALGEVYGRFAPLNELGIAVRRVRSNLDDPENYRITRRPQYLPREFRFRTSSAELMDLLITPLYGSKPEVGVRELIQNAVDACLERDDLASKGAIGAIEKPHEDVVVSVKVEPGGAASIVVEDFGVGMTAEVVDQYFLNIGASFRSSDLWRKNHEIDGQSTIHRTGRFGIGLLAAFLLGKEVRVTTRHVLLSDADGLTFNCHQGSESIEVRQCSFHAGTKIEIELTKGAKDQLVSDANSWDWFCLGRPQVTRKLIDNTECTLPQLLLVPDCDADIESTKWRRIDAEGYDDVMWSYEALKNGLYNNRVVICNGIFVTGSHYRIRPRISPGLDVLRASGPALVVFDPDGRFPLNLQRDEMIGQATSIQDALAKDVSNFFVDKVLQGSVGLRPGLQIETIAFSLDARVPGLCESDQKPRTAGMIITGESLLPVDLDVLSEFQPSCILIDAINLVAIRGSFSCPQIAASGIPYLAVDGVSKTKSSRIAFLKDSLGISGYSGNLTGFFTPLKIKGRRLFVRKEDEKELVTPGNVPRTQWNRLHKEFDGEEYALWAIGNVPEHKFDLAQLDKSLSGSSALGFTIVYFDWSAKPEGVENSKTPFGTAWRELIGGVELKIRAKL